MSKSIEDFDRKIIELLSERTERYVEELKRKGAAHFSLNERCPSTEFFKQYNHGPLPVKVLEKVYCELNSAAYSIVQPVRVAFLGPRGTFSNIAVHEFFGESFVPVPQNTIPDVFFEVESGNARYGVVPVENSTEGGVTYTLDELIETGLKIIAEKYIKITYCLLSKESDLSAVKKIFSHSQPLGQCKHWIRSHLPAAEIYTVDSTSRAAEHALGEDNAAAISSTLAADLYKLNIITSGLEDSRLNFTRFFLMGTEEPFRTGNDKTSIVCSVHDKAGALRQLLEPFSTLGISMTKIESRPNKKMMWDYNFFIDFMGHREDTIIRSSLESIRSEAAFLKILGSYPAGN